MVNIFSNETYGTLQYNIMQQPVQHKHTVELYRSIQELEIQTKQSKTDMDEIDRLLTFVLCYPSLELAKIHHTSNNLGTNDLLLKQKQIQTQIRQQQVSRIDACDCCGVMAHNEPLPYCINLEDLNQGMGIYLFFKNYSFNTIVFLLMFLFYSTYSFSTNLKVYDYVNGNSVTCDSSSYAYYACGLSQISGGMKVLNQSDYANRFSQIQSWIAVAFVGLWGILYVLKTHYQQIFAAEINGKRITASDFTLMLTHIPRQYFVDMGKSKITPEKLAQRTNFRKKSSKQKHNDCIYLSNEQITKKFNVEMMDYGRRINSLVSYEVVKVNIAKPLYQISQQEEKQQVQMDKKLRTKLSSFRQMVYQRKMSTAFKTPQSKRIALYEDYMNFYVNQYQKHNKRQVQYADNNVVFLTFRSSTARQQIQKRNRPPSLKNFWNCCKENDFPLKGVKVRRAPEPEEIKWNVVGFPKTKKRLRRLAMWIVTILLIGVSLGISIGIAFINRTNLNLGISVGISIVVTVVNIGIQMVIVYISYFQNEYVSSRQQSNIALKIGFAQLVNSIGVPIAVGLISHAGTAMQIKPWLKAGGLPDDVFFIALLNVLVPIGLFFDPWQRYLRVKRWWYSKPNNRLYIHGQKQFNKYFGNYDFDIGYEYAYLIKTGIYTSFFVCLQPMIALFAPIGLGLYYLATKRNLLYHFKRPNFHFPTINKAVDMILLLNLLAFGFGHLFVNNFLHDEIGTMNNGTLVTNWIIVIVATFFIVVVPMRIFQCCLSKPQSAQHDYLQKRMLLKTEYDRMNPQTRQSAVYDFKDYLNKLQKAQGLPNEAQFIRLTLNMKIQQKQKEQTNHNLMTSQLAISANHHYKSTVSQTHEPIYHDDIDKYQKIAQEYVPNSQDNINKDGSEGTHNL